MSVKVTDKTQLWTSMAFTPASDNYGEEEENPTTAPAVSSLSYVTPVRQHGHAPKYVW